MKGYRCIGPCLEDIDESALEEEYRYWSNPDSWGPNGTVPVEGDDVVIKSGWNMIYDLEESPIVNKLEINGHLTFQ